MQVWEKFFVKFTFHKILNDFFAKQKTSLWGLFRRDQASLTDSWGVRGGVYEVWELLQPREISSPRVHHIFLHDAINDEDEDTLGRVEQDEQGVENGRRHGVNREEGENPGQAEEDAETKRAPNLRCGWNSLDWLRGRFIVIRFGCVVHFLHHNPENDDVEEQNDGYGHCEGSDEGIVTEEAAGTEKREAEEHMKEARAARITGNSHGFGFQAVVLAADGDRDDDDDGRNPWKNSMCAIIIYYLLFNNNYNYLCFLKRRKTFLGPRQRFLILLFFAFHSRTALLKFQ